MTPPVLSCGVIPVRPDADGPRFLLLRAYRYWDFPKGKVEPNESPFAAAQREMREETGIDAVEYPWGQRFVETPPYRGGKIARYYLGLTAAQRITLPINPELGRPEHHEARWVCADEARGLLGERVGIILDWAIEVLQEQS